MPRRATREPLYFDNPDPLYPRDPRDLRPSLRNTETVSTAAPSYHPPPIGFRFRTTLYLTRRAMTNVLSNAQRWVSMNPREINEPMTLWGFPVIVSDTMDTCVMVVDNGQLQVSFQFPDYNASEPNILQGMIREAEKRLEYEITQAHHQRIQAGAIPYSYFEEKKKPRRGAKVRSILILEDD